MTLSLDVANVVNTANVSLLSKIIDFGNIRKYSNTLYIKNAIESENKLLSIVVESPSFGYIFRAGHNGFECARLNPRVIKWIMSEQKDGKQ